MFVHNSLFFVCRIGGELAGNSEEDTGFRKGGACNCKLLKRGPFAPPTSRFFFMKFGGTPKGGAPDPKDTPPPCIRPCNSSIHVRVRNQNDFGYFYLETHRNMYKTPKMPER